LISGCKFRLGRCFRFNALFGKRYKSAAHSHFALPRNALDLRRKIRWDCYALTNGPRCIPFVLH
jgi:hypothetical protein